MENNQKWASAGPSLNLIFGVFCVLFWVSLCGFVKPEALFFLGLVQVFCFPGYFFASLLMLKDNDGFGGNVFYIFATFFALVSGMINVISYLAPIYHWPIDPTIFGYVWLYVGIYLAITLLGFKKAPWPVFLMVLLAAVVLLLLGVVGIGLISASYSVIAGWILLAIGVIGMYLAVAGQLGFAGINLPSGKPLFK